MPEKCVLVIDRHLPLGLVANTAAILGITLGARLPQMVGADVEDSADNTHLGIVSIPVPVLQGTQEQLAQLWEMVRQPEYHGLTVADFSDLAQGCKTYEAYMEKMARTSPAALQYLGLAICGAKKQISHLTGNLPLLR